MSDLIDRAEAIRIASGYCHPANIAEELRKLPAVKPERKTGRWIDDNCSECGQYVYHGDARNFCPNCGADMRGEQDE